jgi:serine O-acetyltransferase
MPRDDNVVGMVEGLLPWRRNRLVRELLMLYGIDMPPEVVVGKDLKLIHRGIGSVFHPATSIGDRVQIYHQVTIGRADAHLPREKVSPILIEIGDDVVIYPGAKVLCRRGVLRIGNGTIIGANAVVTRSTGEREIWAGIPARCVGRRK